MGLPGRAGISRPSQVEPKLRSVKSGQLSRLSSSERVTLGGDDTALDAQVLVEHGAMQP